MPRAFKCFLQQDYDNRELLVLDDGSDIVRDLVPDDLRIKYFYELPKKTTARRSIAVSSLRVANL
jgi:glycosyltransferase involved in cell wall biosynthesis